MVAFRYLTVNRKILTLVHHYLCLMYWQPLYSKQIETRSVPHPGNDCQQSVNDFWSCILGNLSGDWLQIFIKEVLAIFIGKRESDILPAPS